MKDDWLNKLRNLREEAKKQAPKPEEVQIGKIDHLLKEVNAFEHLRDIKKELLGGVGRIELIEDVSGYDLVMVLMWNGPLHNPTHPKENSKNRCHIFIGVNNKKLWVNGKPLPKNTSEKLQEALLEAAKNPATSRKLIGSKS